ncbi:hypothetical protein [uncultured Draconibacterium sp.]|uniref:hypothetical protein n=1 Tax=uncultured Draconibacterium sp. TaxID=1573823 RepID=UPI0029C8E02E|nr:hypothetical protein [uncultured Draconibacterium sp.]
MKNYFIYISIIFSQIFIGFGASAQNDLGEIDDLERIALSVIVPYQVEGIPDHAQSLLESRLMKAVTNKGIGSDPYSSPFAITAKMEIVTKDITPSVPPMQAYTFEIYFYMVDNIDQIVLSSTSVPVKGVGQNKNRAYTNALRKLNLDNREFDRFLSSGKEKIIKYYNDRCDVVIAKAQALAAQQQYQDAIFLLSSVPEVCEECYFRSLEAIAPIYQEYIRLECASYLNSANALFAANPNSTGALQAAEMISLIPATSSCFENASGLINKIETKMRSDEDRDWNFRERMWGDQVDLEQRRINAYREVGVAFGENQKSNYDVLWLFND